MQNFLVVVVHASSQHFFLFFVRHCLRSNNSVQWCCWDKTGALSQRRIQMPEQMVHVLLSLSWETYCNLYNCPKATVTIMSPHSLTPAKVLPLLNHCTFCRKMGIPSPGLLPGGARSSNRRSEHNCSQIAFIFLFLAICRFSLQNGEQVFMGAPGSWYWQGKQKRSIQVLTTRQAWKLLTFHGANGSFELSWSGELVQNWYCTVITTTTPCFKQTFIRCVGMLNSTVAPWTQLKEFWWFACREPSKKRHRKPQNTLSTHPLL